MPYKEQLVELLPEWQYRRREQEHHAKRSNDTPDPVVELGFRCMLSRLHVVVKIDCRMNACLQSGDASNPAVQKQICRMRPVR